MAIRTAEAEWRGDLKQGNGHMRLMSGAFDGGYSFGSRMGGEKGTNPEELIAAAHAGCFSMALAAQLKEAGFDPQRIHTTAKVHFDQKDGRWTIHTIELQTDGVVPGIPPAEFQRIAESAKTGCPVSRALGGVDIRLNARLQ